MTPTTHRPFLGITPKIAGVIAKVIAVFDILAFILMLSAVMPMLSKIQEPNGKAQSGVVIFMMGVAILYGGFLKIVPAVGLWKQKRWGWYAQLAVIGLGASGAIKSLVGIIAFMILLAVLLLIRKSYLAIEGSKSSAPFINPC